MMQAQIIITNGRVTVQRWDHHPTGYTYRGYRPTRSSMIRLHRVLAAGHAQHWLTETGSIYRLF